MGWTNQKWLRRGRHRSAWLSNLRDEISSLDSASDADDGSYDEPDDAYYAQLRLENETWMPSDDERSWGR